ncbi:hypothetical protein Q1695_007478 [Nippostrongylus brasiliensis]|nr:hypothetical protein Q1695_007478 [Nippostrongylus brasiliensis]
MSIQIFDLDRLIEYRKTQLKGSTRDQLFSFDGLTPGTWFAFRIHYQLYYENSHQIRHDLKTKQEIIVRTKESQYEDPTKINDSIAFIDDLFLTKDNIYIGVASVFKDTKKAKGLVEGKQENPKETEWQIK